MSGNTKESTSGEQDVPKTPAGSTSPVHQERIVLQENNDGDLHLTCRQDPGHPGEWRCTQVPGPVVPKADSSVSMPSDDTLPGKSSEVGSGTPASDGVEVWNRSNGETLRVKRIEHEGSVLFLPIAATPQPQPVDPQSPPVKTTKQDPAVGRTQMSRRGSGSKASCKLSGMRPSPRAKQNDQISGGP
ncbi:MAG: hypothetical protein ABSB80_09770 [Methanoregula sp.]|uniref:hypothetical protein n=1 Tax=Methanoregula sp. TaxID=2052170 RepID=UPI003D14FB3A